MLRERHTCLNGVEWDGRGAMTGLGNGHGQIMGVGMQGGMLPGAGNVGANVGVMGGGMGGVGRVEIRQDEAGNIVGGARVLGPVDGQNTGQHPNGLPVPVLPKVQRNSASRLPFLMEILPKLMHITKETTPVEIREVLLREYGAEVHLQQCRRAKTEILKKQAGESENRGEGTAQQQHTPQQQNQHQLPQPQHGGAANMGQQQMDGITNESGTENNQQLFGDMGSIPNASPRPFAMHNPSAVVPPPVSDRSSATMMPAGEAPVRCPYCINHRWMRSIKDAVDHMSMHVVTD